MTLFRTDFLFVPFLIIINWKIRYKLGKNDDGCKTMLKLRQSYGKRYFNILIYFISHFNTLIDNIFSSAIDPDIISGNLTATISDHLPQFSIIPNMFGNVSGNKSNIYEWDWSKFD